MPASDANQLRYTCRNIAGVARSYEIFLLNCGQCAGAWELCNY